jgi:hypothetical protein
MCKEKSEGVVVVCWGKVVESCEDGSEPSTSISSQILGNDSNKSKPDSGGN